ncbi:MAG TPA: tyrosine-type recombinase/integrase, partial [Aquirhabdus sp.]
RAKRKVVHRPALALERLPELLQRIHADTGQPLTKLCLLLCLNVFIRSSEIRFARWNEVNFDRSMWTIPPTREAVEGAKYSDRGAKMQTAHLVHLSPQSLHLLKQAHQFSGYTKNIFPKHGDLNLFISESTMNDLAPEKRIS